MIKHNTRKSNTRLHTSIIISVLVIVASSLSFYFIPIVKSDLPGPYYVRGYIYYWNTSTSEYDPIPSGKTVTLTNNNATKGKNITTTTLSNGAYQANVGKDSGLDCDNNNQIVVNCSYRSQMGENATNIDTGKTFRWCNLTGTKKLQNESLSVNITTPWSWNAGTLLIGTTGTNSNHTNSGYFNLTNKGNVKINVYVQGHNITWGGSNKWWLNLSAGLNGYTFRYNLSGGGSLTNIRVFNTTFKQNLKFHSNYFSYTYWQKFGLNITMPSSSTVADPPQLNTTITFWAIKA